MGSYTFRWYVDPARRVLCVGGATETCCANANLTCPRGSEARQYKDVSADVCAAREHPSDEVFVTGTFDNWSKSVKLDRDGTAHEKTVDLPKSDEKILYKVRDSVHCNCCGLTLRMHQHRHLAVIWRYPVMLPPADILPVCRRR